MKLIIYGRPYTKKNSQEIAINKKTGARFVRQSKQYRTYEADALWQIKEWRLKNDEPICILSPCHVRALYFLPDRRKTDLLGLENATADILEKARIIADDELIVSWDGSRIIAGGRYGGEPDKENPRVEIEIMEAYNEQRQIQST